MLRAPYDLNNITAVMIVPSAHRTHGYTLLEMLVVLSLVGAVVALIFPSINRLAQVTTDRSQYQRVVADLSDLPARAFVLGTGLRLDGTNWSQTLGDGRAALTLAPGWAFSMTPPLAISAGGICSNAQGQLRSDAGVTWQVQVTAVTCDVQIVAAQGSTAIVPTNQRRTK